MKAILGLYRTVLFLGILLIAFLVTSFAQEKQRGNRFGLEVGGGVIGIDNFETTEFVFHVTPRFSISRLCWAIDPPPAWCFALELPIIVKPFIEPDPWQGRIPFRDLNIPLSDLDVGPAVFVAPNFAITISPGARINPTLFVGGGFVYEGGQDTEIPNVGKFKTDSVTDPLLTYGVNISWRLADPRPEPSLFFKLQVRAFTVFMSEMNVTLPDGKTVRFEGMNVTSENILAGLEFRF